MEQIGTITPRGLSEQALRTWGMLFTAMGLASRTLIQNRMLGLGSVSTAQLLEAMQASGTTMALATLALVLQAAATCAVPIFALLLVEQYGRTESFRALFLRVLGIALLSEIPYDLAVSGRWLEPSEQNPVFALTIGLVLLYFYSRYGEKTPANLAIKAVVTAAALGWGAMLQVRSGAPILLITAVLWAFRGRPLYRTFAGAAAAVVCTGISPFYLASPMGFLAVHFYNGQPAGQSMAFDLSYPVLALVFAAAAYML